MAVTYNPTCDFYMLLAIPEDSGSAEILQAHRGLARQHHPDRHRGDPAKTRLLQDLNLARDILMDPQQRQHYDSQRKVYFSRGARKHPMPVS